MKAHTSLTPSDLVLKENEVAGGRKAGKYQRPHQRPRGGCELAGKHKIKKKPQVRYRPGTAWNKRGLGQSPNKKKVIRLGFEPKTHSLEGCCSIQLSYRTSPAFFKSGCKYSS